MTAERAAAMMIVVPIAVAIHDSRMAKLETQFARMVYMFGYFPFQIYFKKFASKILANIMPGIQAHIGIWRLGNKDVLVKTVKLKYQRQ